MVYEARIARFVASDYARAPQAVEGVCQANVAQPRQARPVVMLTADERGAVEVGKVAEGARRELLVKLRHILAGHIWEEPRVRQMGKMGEWETRLTVLRFTCPRLKQVPLVRHYQEGDSVHWPDTLRVLVRLPTSRGVPISTGRGVSSHRLLHL